MKPVIGPQPSRFLPGDKAWSRVNDVVIMGVGLAVFYAVLTIARTWFRPVTPEAQVSLSPYSLPVYAAYSLLRIMVAYVFSLGFAVAYGYVAAYNKTAERILLPALDILQSIPVLSFLPGVMLAMAAIFPHSQLGLELGSILLIFTGQTWNIAFSFYSSLKSIPRELIEAARINRFSAWQRFTSLELPYSTIGLVWNSMMSVAGGWFFLMVCEMFPLGERQIKLPGLGSYIQTAANKADAPAILWGLGAMVAVIVLLDQLVWRPVIAWADKFKFEEIESASAPGSAVLDLLRRSNIIGFVTDHALTPVSERLISFFAETSLERPPEPPAPPRRVRPLTWLLAALVVAAAAYGVSKAAVMLVVLTRADLALIGRGAAATFLRVAAALIIGAAWTIPAGVMIGFSPRLARIAQPLAQIAASIPATGLFPVVLLILIQNGLIRAGGNLGAASLLLMLLGTQWYILFNVIAGAMAIPTDLKEAASIFKFGAIDKWRLLILPGIFPYLITGIVTAAGGAWNASIVAEYMPFGDRVLSTTGLGATIAASTANFPLLLGSTVAMAAIVVTINRLVWRPLYRLAESRYKLGG
ncbi:MAG TPA: ABC transporter permease subunit [Blastocatellia bacterium]|nr:ABC transporter permease subunit [Blastocatellia bacterium]